MGKWSKIVATLPKYVGDDASYQQKVEALKREILNPSNVETFRQRLYAVNFLDNVLIEIDNAMSSAREWLKTMVLGRGLGQSPAAFASAYIEVRRLKEELEAHLKAVNLYELSIRQLMEERYQVEDVENLKLSDGTSVRVQKEPYAQVKDKAAYRAWCIENGYESEMTLPWQTTNGIVKELLEKGEPEPPGIAVFGNTKVFVTKGKDK